MSILQDVGIQTTDLPKTDKAVKAYQKRKGLMEDGKVGVKTLAKMAEDCK